MTSGTGKAGSSLGDRGLGRRTCGIADNGQEDQADELLADVSGVCKAVDRVDKELGGYSNELSEMTRLTHNALAYDR